MIAPLRAASALLALVVWLCGAHPLPAAADDGWTRALLSSAERLWNPLPPGSRIALRPLDPDDSGLPDGLLREVEQALAAALLATAPPGGAIATRRDLPAVWEEVESFADAPSRRLLADAAVDAVVVPAIGETADGVGVSGVLISVGEGDAGTVLATLPRVALPVDVGRFDLADAVAAARRLGVALAEGLRLSSDPVAQYAVRIERHGPRSDLTDWFGAMVEGWLSRRLAEPPRYIARSLRDLGAPPADATVRLELEAWDQREGRVDVQARAAMDGARAAATVRVAAASIPAAFRPLTRDGGRIGRGLFAAAATYVPDRRTDPVEAGFAARVLARATVIDDRLRQGDGPHRGVGQDAVARAMRGLERAIPHEEIWRNLPADSGTVARAVRARVAAVGGADAPRLEAAVDRALHRDGEPLRARLTVRGGRAFVAAYAWQADDTVVRIAPTGLQARPVEPERRLSIPFPGEAEVAAAAMPGSLETMEAVIVVASAMPFAADALAPAAAGSPDASRAAAVAMSGFLDALARLDLARVRLAVLPYRVRAGE